jgi:hypothetical protein
MSQTPDDTAIGIRRCLGDPIKRIQGHQGEKRQNEKSAENSVGEAAQTTSSA